MSKQNHDLSRTNIGELYDRIVSILEQARSNTVRAVNSNMVIAYWLIGREILNEIQGGTKRAAYGKQIIEQLSKQLTTIRSRIFSRQSPEFQAVLRDVPRSLDSLPTG